VSVKVKSYREYVEPVGAEGISVRASGFSPFRYTATVPGPFPAGSLASEGSRGMGQLEKSSTRARDAVRLLIIREKILALKFCTSILRNNYGK
jgi:hypothetical protein